MTTLTELMAKSGFKSWDDAWREGFRWDDNPEHCFYHFYKLMYKVDRKLPKDGDLWCIDCGQPSTDYWGPLEGIGWCSKHAPSDDYDPFSDPSGETSLAGAMIETIRVANDTGRDG